MDKTAFSKLFTALDKDGNDVDLNDESKLSTITNIRANYALWSVDWISAKGKSSGGSGGGGGLINLVYGFESLGGTFDNNDNSATFNAFTINEIWKLASSGLTNVTITGSGNAVTDVIKGSDGRSLTFTKGSTFATKSEFDALNTKFNDFLTGSDADDIINKWSELEVFLQGMKESDNLAVILQSKMDKTAFSKLFTALDASGNEVDPSDDTKTIASIRANFGFWGVDYISAKGVSNGSGGTGGASALYQLVDVLANDTEDGVEGAAAGKALVFDGTHWRAGDAGLNESQLYSYLTANKYLTQSAADSRYVTSSRKVIAGTGLSGGGALTSDVTLSLGTSGVVAGTYTKVMVDAYGRVTSGTNLSATDIPNLDWSKITTGKPTTLAGYGITDAVTLTTAQTISGRKTFSQNIVFNNNGGITYTDSNVVLRNSDGHTILASFGNGEINLRPNGDTSDVGVVQINKQGHINGVSAGFKGGVSAARLSATEYVQIGDAYLKWDAANNAVYVIKKDGTTPVGFYSTDWLSAKGVSISGVQTGTLADLNDVEITDPVNGQALKYDAASKKWVNGTIDSFNVNQMWAELKKADSSKIIDASHIPTSVLDGRWVKKTGDTMTGTLTSASSSGSIVFKGVENCDITNIYKDNGVIKNDDGGFTSIRNGLRFNWYDTYWYIGNLRGSSTDSAGFGIVDHNNKLVLRVTPNDVRAPRFMSTVATGVSPLIVNSTTVVENLNSYFLEGRRADSFTSIVGRHSIYTIGTAPYNYIYLFRIANSAAYSTLRVDIDIKTRYHRAVLFVDINSDKYPYGDNGTRISISKLQLNSQGARLLYKMTKQSSGYNYIDFYYESGAWNSGSYDVILRGSNGTLVFEPKNTNIDNIPSGCTEVIKTPLDGDISGNAATATALKNSRTLWGQPFNGTANVSGDMTGVGSITMSGDLKIGNGTSPNTIYFYGTTGDSPGNYNHTFIAERLWGGTESSELVLFKGNDLGNDNEAVNVSNAGPDRIRHIAAAHLFQTYTSPLAGSVEDVCTSSALKNLFSIASNRVISYVQLQSTIASGVAPFIVASNTVVSNLNADLLDGQHLSDLDGRYVNVTGDTMTGDLTMNNTKGFNIGWSTRVVKTSGVWIHGGGDTASSTDANLRFGSWQGIGWYPTIDFTSGVRQGNNAMWLNVRTGVLDVHGNITSHNGYLAANWDSARRLVLGGGSTYAWIDSRNSSNNVLCNIVLQDNKVTIGNYAESSRFVSTVGTGTAPYQCSSTTLNTNLNADLLDGYHQTAFSMGWTSSPKYRLDRWGGNQDKNWKKIVTYVNTGGGSYQACKVKGTIYFITGNHNQAQVVDIPFEAIMYAYGGTANSMLNKSTLYLPIYCGWDLIRIVRYADNSWEVQVRQPSDWTNISFEYTATTNGGSMTAGQFANTTYTSSTVANSYNTNVSRPTTSRAGYADKLTTARTLWGRSFDGTANIDGNLDNVGIITSKSGIWLDLKGSSGVAFYSAGSLHAVINSTGMGIGNSSPSQKLHVTGNIIATGAITAKASSSDIRLKTDIQDYDAMGIIRKFRSVKYHWNNLAKRNSEIFNHKKWNYGLIAQDLLSGGYSQWVSDIFKDYYTIDYERLIPVVWKGLQEVDDEVTKLRKEVVRLNKRISELEKFLCA